MLNATQTISPHASTISWASSEKMRPASLHPCHPGHSTKLAKTSFFCADASATASSIVVPKLR